MPRIWQLAHVYRDGERSATHHPEFSMLEWYRAGAAYRDLMDECEALLRAAQEAAGAEALRWRGRSADARASVAAPHRRRGVRAPRRASTCWRPHPTRSGPTPALLGRGGGADRHRAAPGGRLGDPVLPHFSRTHRAQSRDPGAPTILYDYPLSMAALSRRKPDDPRLAERFELYVCGLELANAFGELTDPAEQRRRFAADQARKQALYGETYPIDEDFLAALEHGLPECAGIALGFDRLVMLATGADHIEEVLWAPVR